METLLALVVGVLIATAVYLLLRPNLLRVLFGVILLGNAVNLALFTAGRIPAGAAPPLVPEGMPAPPDPVVANPLPQALVLTAIVIGFGLVAFALVLALRVYQALGTMTADEVERVARDPEVPPTAAPPPDAQQDDATGAGLPEGPRL